MARLIALLLAACVGFASSNALGRRLKDWQRWFKERGGRWGTGVDAEVHGGACWKPLSAWHDEVQALGSYRVVTRSRVPRETVRAEAAAAALSRPTWQRYNIRPSLFARAAGAHQHAALAAAAAGGAVGVPAV
jgi:hypothetical protein